MKSKKRSVPREEIIVMHERGTTAEKASKRENIRSIEVNDEYEIPRFFKKKSVRGNKPVVEKTDKKEMTRVVVEDEYSGGLAF